jgi:hypothetical protein
MLIPHTVPRSRQGRTPQDKLRRPQLFAWRGH